MKRRARKPTQRARRRGGAANDQIELRFGGTRKRTCPSCR